MQQKSTDHITRNVNVIQVFNLTQIKKLFKSPNVHVLVYLQTLWCPSCIPFKQYILEKVSFQQNLMIACVDIDSAQSDICKFFKLKSIPSVMLFKGNIQNKIMEFVGGDLKKLEEIIKRGSN